MPWRQEKPRTAPHSSQSSRYTRTAAGSGRARPVVQGRGAKTPDELDSLQKRLHALVGKDDALVEEVEEVWDEGEGEEPPADFEEDGEEVPLEEGDEGYEQEGNKTVDEAPEDDGIDDQAIDELLNMASATSQAEAAGEASAGGANAALDPRAKQKSKAKSKAKAKAKAPMQPRLPTAPAKASVVKQLRQPEGKQPGTSGQGSRSEPVAGSPSNSNSTEEINGVHINTDATCVADVRFGTAADATSVVEECHGGVFETGGFGPNTIAVIPNETCQDGRKVVVHGLPKGIQWQELKDFFKQYGQVAYAAVRQPLLPAQQMPPFQQIPFVQQMPFVQHEPMVPMAALGPADAAPQLVDGCQGEVRYVHREHALEAVRQLDGTNFLGARIRVHLDALSKDGTKIVVSGIPFGAEWLELKYHFSSVGLVTFADVKGRPPKGEGGKGAVFKGKGPGPYGGCMGLPSGPMMQPGGFKGKGFAPIAKGKGYGL